MAVMSTLADAICEAISVCYFLLRVIPIPEAAHTKVLALITLRNGEVHRLLRYAHARHVPVSRANSTRNSRGLILTQSRSKPGGFRMGSRKNN